MLSLTRKTDYAMVALALLAGAEPGRLSAREIARRCRVPLPLLMNILTELVHQGLVVSTRGAKGGYRLGRRPEEITLAGVIRVMEGSAHLTPCCWSEPENSGARCDLETCCPVRLPVRRINALLQGFLDRVTLAHLAAQGALPELSADPRCGSASGPETVATGGPYVRLGV